MHDNLAHNHKDRVRLNEQTHANDIFRVSTSIVAREVSKRLAASDPPVCHDDEQAQAAERSNEILKCPCDEDLDACATNLSQQLRLGRLRVRQTRSRGQGVIRRCFIRVGSDGLSLAQTE